jgi:hypothetical protein
MIMVGAAFRSGAAGRGSVGWMHIGLYSLSRDSIG